MKKYLSMILATLLLFNVLTGCAEQNNYPISTLELGSMPDNSFSNEEYQKLLALQFDGYEDMTISDYQSRIWELTDAAECRDLLERFSKSETLYELKDTDETASFLFYVLEPLTAEKWQSRNYSGYATSGFPHPADNATLEYSFTLTILNADTLTIREYNAVRLNVISGMQDILSGKSEEDLQNKASMSVAIQNDIDSLIKQLQTEKIAVVIEHAYFPLSSQSNDDSKYLQNVEDQEQRRYSSGTEEDYHSLLSLKTPDYQNMSLANFNAALLCWANENPERIERISEDTVWNDFQVTLTDEELSFVKLTVFLSGMEYGKDIQNSYTGTQAAAPYCGEYLPQKTTDENGMAAWCSMFYQFSYSISEKETVTVGERDRQIEGVINAIHAFWNDTDIESMLEMSENDIVKELETLATMYSTSNIKIATDIGQVHFERMDERKDVNY